MCIRDSEVTILQSSQSSPQRVKRDALAFLSYIRRQTGRDRYSIRMSWSWDQAEAILGPASTSPASGVHRVCGNPYRNYCTSAMSVALTRVTKSYLLALGTTHISSFFTKHWTKFLTHQTGNHPVTCFVSKPSRSTLVVLSIINTSYQKLPFGSGDYPDKLLYHQALN